ncbi:hypothetical protein [Chryseobacterium sp. IT-36CA2]|uniref:hypothetical protein n=1 Tax=Chryseobacterium sp. IT-36CA2 TaxID=3026460 RepID=UPI0039DFA0F2
MQIEGKTNLFSKKRYNTKLPQSTQYIENQNNKNSNNNKTKKVLGEEYQIILIEIHTFFDNIKHNNDL